MHFYHKLQILSFLIKDNNKIVLFPFLYENLFYLLFIKTIIELLMAFLNFLFLFLKQL